MGLVVKVGDAKTRLSELLALAEAGEDVVIARGGTPIVRLTPVRTQDDARAAMEEIIEARKRVNGPTTLQEIFAWRDEGRR